MDSISSISYREKITIERGQGEGTNPKVDDEGFEAMFAMLLGLTNPAGNELLPIDLSAEKVGDSLYQQSNSGNPAVISLITMLTPELQAKQQTAEDAVLLNNNMSNPAIENSGVSTKTENYLQPTSVMDELALLQQKTEDNGAKAKHPAEPLSEEKLAVFSNSLAKGRLYKEGNMANLTNSNGQGKSTENGEEINKLKEFNNFNEGMLKQNEGMIEQNNEVLTQEELLVKAFAVNDKGNADGLSKDLTVKAEQLPQELPELVMSKLKTFEHKDGSKDMVIHLEPKELGKLVVKLTLQEGIVSVKFMAHYPVTRDLLESSLNNLRQSFSEQGISFDRMDVELGGQQLDQSQYQQQQQWGGGLGKANPTMSSGSDAEGYYDNYVLEEEQDVLLEMGTYNYLV